MTQNTARFLPLDVFRGMTVCFMIIVNTPGTDQVFGPLRHAHWHGFTPTDLVFPSFLFAVGNAMSFSMRKFEGLPHTKVIGKVLKRTMLIFLLGFLMYWLPFFRPSASGGLELIPIGETRILGVLQRIALCYGLASLLIHFLPKKGVISAAVVLLLGYWAVLWFFGTPGEQYTIQGNAGLALDKLIMGDAHLYKGEGFPFDPEGILSTFPAIVNVIAGYYAGLYIQQRGKTLPGLYPMLIAGIVLVALAYTWDLSFPINKKLWTSSYVLLTVGLDLLILSVLIYVIDIQYAQGWTGFFTVFGKNPLFLYLLSEVLAIFLYTFKAGTVSWYEWINTHIFQPPAPGKAGSLLFALAYMLLCWVVGKWLDAKRIYVRV